MLENIISWRRSIVALTAVLCVSTSGLADSSKAPSQSRDYWKQYLLDRADDQTIAKKLLTILHDVNGYTGLPKLQIITERTR